MRRAQRFRIGPTLESAAVSNRSRGYLNTVRGNMLPRLAGQLITAMMKLSLMLIWGGRTMPSGKTKPGAETKLAELKHRLLEINDLAAAGALLGWDQSTYMPRGGAPARARQGATLSKLAHEKSVDPALGKLLDELVPYAAGLPYQSDEASLIRVARRDFEKAIKVPSAYVARASALGSASYDAWTRARPANDFATMRPFLEQAVDLSREYAGFFAPYQH